MADENKPLTDGEQAAEAAEELAETLRDTAEAVPETAETAAESAADAASAEAAAEVEAIVQDALGTNTGTEMPAAEPAPAAEKPERKAAPHRKPAKKSGLAGLLPKKKKKKRPRKRTIEDELADLAAEEAAFDAWGRPIKKKKKRKRRKTRKLSCTLVLLTLILALASVLSVVILAVAKEMYGIEKSVDKKVVNIPEGVGTQAIAEQLVDDGMITLPLVFRLVSRMNHMDGKYIAGDHILTASMSYETMIEELCTTDEEGGREYHDFVIYPGENLLSIAKRLQENEFCSSSEKFLFYFNSGGYNLFNFEKYLPEKSALKFQQMEGYCFPDTYQFYINEDPSIIAQKIYANFDTKITEGDYQKMNELGMSLDEVITLASMIQAEAGSKEDMGKISSVFHNRITHSGEFPKLQSDPTRKYAEDVIEPNLDRENETMLTAYNTYEGNGLPPGAIGNPQREAIEAALYPEQTNYFYFNANVDTGQTFFAETYEQHLQNLALVEAQYRAANEAANGGNPNE